MNDLRKMVLVSEERRILKDAIVVIEKKIENHDNTIREISTELNSHEKEFVREFLCNSMSPAEMEKAEENYKLRHSNNQVVAFNREIFYPWLDDFKVTSAEMNEDKTFVRFLIETGLNKWSVSGLMYGQECMWTEWIPFRKFDVPLQASPDFLKMRELLLNKEHML